MAKEILKAILADLEQQDQNTNAADSMVSAAARSTLKIPRRRPSPPPPTDLDRMARQQYFATRIADSRRRALMASIQAAKKDTNTTILAKDGLVNGKQKQPVGPDYFRQRIEASRQRAAAHSTQSGKHSQPVRSKPESLAPESAPASSSVSVPSFSQRLASSPQQASPTSSKTTTKSTFSATSSPPMKSPIIRTSTRQAKSVESSTNSVTNTSTIPNSSWKPNRSGRETTNTYASTPQSLPTTTNKTAGVVTPTNFTLPNRMATVVNGLPSNFTSAQRPSKMTGSAPWKAKQTKDAPFPWSPARGKQASTISRSADSTRDFAPFNATAARAASASSAAVEEKSSSRQPPAKPTTLYQFPTSTKKPSWTSNKNIASSNAVNLPWRRGSACNKTSVTRNLREVSEGKAPLSKSPLTTINTTVDISTRSKQFVMKQEPKIEEVEVQSPNISPLPLNNPAWASNNTFPETRPAWKPASFNNADSFPYESGKQTSVTAVPRGLSTNFSTFTVGVKPRVEAAPFQTPGGSSSTKSPWPSNSNTSNSDANWMPRSFSIGTSRRENRTATEGPAALSTRNTFYVSSHKIFGSKNATMSQTVAPTAPFKVPRSLSMGKAAWTPDKASLSTKTFKSPETNSDVVLMNAPSNRSENATTAPFPSSQTLSRSSSRPVWTPDNIAQAKASSSSPGLAKTLTSTPSPTSSVSSITKPAWASKKNGSTTRKPWSPGTTVNGTQERLASNSSTFQNISPLKRNTLAVNGSDPSVGKKAVNSFFPSSGKLSNNLTSQTEIRNSTETIKFSSLAKDWTQRGGSTVAKLAQTPLESPETSSNATFKPAWPTEISSTSAPSAKLRKEQSAIPGKPPVFPMSSQAKPAWSSTGNSGKTSLKSGIVGGSTKAWSPQSSGLEINSRDLMIPPARSVTTNMTKAKLENESGAFGASKKLSSQSQSSWMAPSQPKDTGTKTPWSRGSQERTPAWLPQAVKKNPTSKENVSFIGNGLSRNMTGIHTDVEGKSLSASSATNSTTYPRVLANMTSKLPTAASKAVKPSPSKANYSSPWSPGVQPTLKGWKPSSTGGAAKQRTAIGIGENTKEASQLRQWDKAKSLPGETKKSNGSEQKQQVELQTEGNNTRYLASTSESAIDKLVNTRESINIRNSPFSGPRQNSSTTPVLTTERYTNTSNSIVSNNQMGRVKVTPVVSSKMSESLSSNVTMPSEKQTVGGVPVPEGKSVAEMKELYAKYQKVLANQTAPSNKRSNFPVNGENEAAVDLTGEKMPSRTVPSWSSPSSASKYSQKENNRIANDAKRLVDPTVVSALPRKTSSKPPTTTKPNAGQSVGLVKVILTMMGAAALPALLLPGLEDGSLIEKIKTGTGSFDQLSTVLPKLDSTNDASSGTSLMESEEGRTSDSKIGTPNDKEETSKNKINDNLDSEEPLQNVQEGSSTRKGEIKREDSGLSTDSPDSKEILTLQGDVTESNINRDLSSTVRPSIVPGTFPETSDAPSSDEDFTVVTKMRDLMNRIKQETPMKKEAEEITTSEITKPRMDVKSMKSGEGNDITESVDKEDESKITLNSSKKLKESTKDETAPTPTVEMAPSNAQLEDRTSGNVLNVEEKQDFDAVDARKTQSDLQVEGIRGAFATEAGGKEELTGPTTDSAQAYARSDQLPETISGVKEFLAKVKRDLDAIQDEQQNPQNILQLGDTWYHREPEAKDPTGVSSASNIGPSSTSPDGAADNSSKKKDFLPKVSESFSSMKREPLAELENRKAALESKDEQVASGNPEIKTETDSTAQLEPGSNDKGNEMDAFLAKVLTERESTSTESNNLPREGLTVKNKPDLNSQPHDSLISAPDTREQTTESKHTGVEDSNLMNGFFSSIKTEQESVSTSDKETSPTLGKITLERAPEFNVAKTLAADKKSNSVDPQENDKSVGIINEIKSSRSEVMLDPESVSSEKKRSSRDLRLDNTMSAQELLGGGNTQEKESYSNSRSKSEGKIIIAPQNTGNDRNEGITIDAEDDVQGKGKSTPVQNEEENTQGAISKIQAFMARVMKEADIHEEKTPVPVTSGPVSAPTALYGDDPETPRDPSQKSTQENAGEARALFTDDSQEQKLKDSFAKEPKAEPQSPKQTQTAGVATDAISEGSSGAKSALDQKSQSVFAQASVAAAAAAKAASAIKKEERIQEPPLPAWEFERPAWESDRRRGDISDVEKENLRNMLRDYATQNPVSQQPAQDEEAPALSWIDTIMERVSDGNEI